MLFESTNEFKNQAPVQTVEVTGDPLLVDPCDLSVQWKMFC